MTNKKLAIGLGVGLAAMSAGPTASQAKTPSVIYVQGQTGNPFFTSVTCGAMAEAKKLHVDFSAQGGQQYSPTSQTPVLNAVIAKHPDGILISPMVGPAMVSPLTEAKNAGIKIVYVDTASEPGLAMSFVASDNKAGGALAAGKLAELMGDKGTVMLESAIPGISSTDARRDGFVDEIKKHPGINYIGVQYSQGDPAKATSEINAILSAHADLRGIC
jgi:ribose transport system substrate-binding protein